MSARPAIVWHSDYEIDIGPHVFPTRKFRLVKDLLVQEGVLRDEEILAPPQPSEEELLAALVPEYLSDLRGFRHTPRTRRSELPISREIIHGCERASGGTLLAARKALETGGACHLGGGFHHGYHDHAEGFCYYNDIAVAAANVVRLGLARKVAVIDTDVHQGNGTARIFLNDPNVYTFSIHQEHLYPYVKEVSDLDIGLPVMIGDVEYLYILEQAVRRILREQRPQLVIYVAGVDPYEKDQLGSLGISFAGIVRREEIVLGACAEAGVPFATVTGGGYSRDVADTVALHAATVKVAIDVLR